MRALVTGATGFVGRRLLGRLEKPVVLSRDAGRARASLADFDVAAFSWKTSDTVPPTTAFEGVDTVFHLARESVADLTDADPIFWQAEQATIGGRLQSNETTFVQGFPGLIDELAVYDKLLPLERIQAYYLVGTQGGATPLQAGDANQDLAFDPLDLVRVQVSAKYLTGMAATWGEGDWDGAPGGEPGSPPPGNGLFDQVDIIAALGNGLYLTGPYAAVRAGGVAGDEQTSIIYDPTTGELAIDAPASTELTSVNIDSAASIFTGEAAGNLGGSFDIDADNNIFKATFGSSFGSLSFGRVAQTGLAEDFLLGDLSVIGSLSGGGDPGDVDLIYVPEPSSLVLLILAAVTFAPCRRRAVYE